LKAGLNLRKRERVHDVGSGEPPLAGCIHAGLDEPQRGRAVGVGVDRALEAAGGGLPPEAPVHVEPVGARIELYDDAVGDGGVDHFRGIHPIGLALEQDSTGQVTQHGGMRILYGPYDPGGHRGLVLGEGAVDRHNHIIQLGQDGVVEIKAAVRQDVAFRAREDPRLEPPGGVQGADRRHLGDEPLGGEALGLHARLRVVGDPEVFPSQNLGGARHLGERVAAVGLRRVVVESPL
jgi:hypothetical protein